MISTRSMKANGREPKPCLGQVFNYRLDCFSDVHVFIYVGHTHIYSWKLGPGLVLLANVCPCFNWFWYSISKHNRKT